MKAIISRAQEASGEHIYLHGFGHTERCARINTKTLWNGGHNEFDEEAQGGELVEMTEDLHARLTDNDLLEASNAQYYLKLENGVLSYDAERAESSRIRRELEQAELKRLSEIHRRRSDANAAIGEAQANAARIAASDGDIKTLFEIAAHAVNLLPLGEIYEYLKDNPNDELQEAADARAWVL